MRRLINLIVLLGLLLSNAVSTAHFAAASKPASSTLSTYSSRQSFSNNSTNSGKPEEPDQPTSPVWFEPVWLLSSQRAAGADLLADSPSLGLAASSSNLASTFQACAPATQGDWENGWALGCITPLGIVQNAAFGAGWRCRLHRIFIQRSRITPPTLR